MADFTTLLELRDQTCQSIHSILSAFHQITQTISIVLKRKGKILGTAQGKIILFTAFKYREKTDKKSTKYSSRHETPFSFKSVLHILTDLVIILKMKVL